VFIPRFGFEDGMSIGFAEVADRGLENGIVADDFNRLPCLESHDGLGKFNQGYGAADTNDIQTRIDMTRHIESPSLGSIIHG
jgi:hypothetical protein